MKILDFTLIMIMNNFSFKKFVWDTSFSSFLVVATHSGPDGVKSDPPSPQRNFLSKNGLPMPTSLKIQFVATFVFFAMSKKSFWITFSAPMFNFKNGRI